MAQINQLSFLENPQGGDNVPIYSGANGDTRRTSLTVLATWFATAMSNLTFGGYAKVTPVLTANLPSAVTAGTGARAFVTDATATTYNSALTGGGSNRVPVFSDGTVWRIG